MPAAWLAGRWQFDRDGQAASSRTPIDRWAECGCARWHALYQGAVGWANSFTEETVAVRCQTREDPGGYDRIGQDRTAQDGQQSAWVVVGGGGLCVLRWARTTAWDVACEASGRLEGQRRRRPAGRGGVRVVANDRVRYLEATIARVVGRCRYGDCQIADAMRRG